MTYALQITSCPRFGSSVGSSGGEAPLRGWPWESVAGAAKADQANRPAAADKMPSADCGHQGSPATAGIGKTIMVQSFQ
jgi:hypothetical protein